MQPDTQYLELTAPAERGLARQPPEGEHGAPYDDHEELPDDMVKEGIAAIAEGWVDAPRVRLRSPSDRVPSRFDVLRFKRRRRLLLRTRSWVRARRLGGQRQARRTVRTQRPTLVALNDGPPEPPPPTDATFVAFGNRGAQ